MLFARLLPHRGRLSFFAIFLPSFLPLSAVVVSRPIGSREDRRRGSPGSWDRAKRRARNIAGTGGMRRWRGDCLFCWFCAIGSCRRPCRARTVGERLSRRSDLARTARRHRRRARRRYWCRSAAPSRTARRWRSASTMSGCKVLAAKIAERARRRAGGAGHRLCARGRHRSAGGASEIPRHDHRAAGRVRKDPRIRREELQARRLPQHRLFGRPWRLPEG